MPLRVAAIALVSGVAVVAFGIALIAIGPPSDDTTTAMPRATLDPSTADDDRAGVTGTGVRGTVVGRDGDPVDGVTVTLVPLFMEKGVDPIRATTDDHGRFAFDDVAVDPGSPWVAEATFDGARFPSEVLRAPRGKDDPGATRSSPNDEEGEGPRRSRSSRSPIVGDKTGGQAVHALTVVNHGDRAYVGGLRLPLLPGATAIQEGTGLDRRYLALGDDAMTSTRADPSRTARPHVHLHRPDGARRDRDRATGRSSPPSATSCSSATGSHCATTRCVTTVRCSSAPVARNARTTATSRAT